MKEVFSDQRQTSGFAADVPCISTPDDVSSCDLSDMERPFQFRLATLMAVITLFAVYCGLVKWGSPAAMLILLIVSAICGVVVFRHFCIQSLSMTIQGGAAGAGLVMGATGCALAITAPDPTVTVAGRAVPAYLFFTDCALGGMPGGALVGFAYELVMHRRSVSEGSCENDLSSFHEDRQP